MISDTFYHYSWLVLNSALLTSSVLAFFTNFFLLLLFFQRRSLRTVPNRFLINLLIINILSSLLLTPLLLWDNTHAARTYLESSAINETTVELSKFIISAPLPLNKTNLLEERIEIIEKRLISSETLIEQDDNYSPALCYVSQVAINLFATLSILSILLISINQYFGVLHSLRYHFYINKWRSTCAITLMWVVALLSAVFNTLSEINRFTVSHCAHQADIRYSGYLFLFATVYFLLIILVPFLAVSLIYICIYAAAHRNSERMRKSTSTNLIKENDTSASVLPKVHSAPNFVFLQNSSAVTVQRTSSDRRVTSSNSGNFISSLKNKFSGASILFRYREESRAAKIGFFVIVLFLICYLPYGLNVLVNLMFAPTSKLLNSFTLCMLSLSNSITPYLFAYRNQRVKREIGKVFGGKSQVVQQSIVRRRSANSIMTQQPFLEKEDGIESKLQPPELVVTAPSCSSMANKSILKRVKTTSWGKNYKKCNFIIVVPENCCMGEARGSFSSASTQLSNED